MSDLQELHTELLAQSGGLLPVAGGEQPARFHLDLGRPQLLLARGLDVAAPRVDAFRYPGARFNRKMFAF